MIDVLVSGHVCLDIIPTGLKTAQLPPPGQLNEIGAAQVSTGGAVANVGSSLSKLGVTVRLVASVGQDAFATLIKELLQAQVTGDVDLQASDAGTSYTLVLSPAGQDRCFLHYPGANMVFNAQRIHDAHLAQARVLYFGYPPLLTQFLPHDGDRLKRLFQRAQVQRTLTVLDMSMPDLHSDAGRIDWRAFLSNVLPYTDVFLPSLDEIAFMLRYDVPEEPQLLTFAQAVSQELIDMGASLAGIKLAEHGMLLRSNTNRPEGLSEALKDVLSASSWSAGCWWSPAFSVTPSITVGAGDNAVAGFIAGLLKHQTPAQTLTTACAVAACSVEGQDAISSVQDWTSTQQRITQGWTRVVSLPVANARLLAGGVYELVDSLLLLSGKSG